MAARVKARFIEPMLLLKTDALPDDRAKWAYQLKVDGYRCIAFKTGGKLHLRSRNDNDFALRYPSVLKGLARLPDETVIDGELVAFDEDGKPSFNALQNSASSDTPIAFLVFDVLVLAGKDVKGETLEVTRKLLESKVLPKLSEPRGTSAIWMRSFVTWWRRSRSRASKGSSRSVGTAGTSRANVHSRA